MQNFGWIREGTGNAVFKAIPVPKLRNDYILVKVVAIALNPTDWTTLDAPGDDGSLVGCDYSGIVEEVGSAVTRDFKPGDRICGFAHGGNDANYENGAFARYIAVKGDIQMHIPDNVSFETATTTGVGVGTAGYALFKLFGLPLPKADAPSLNGEDKTARDPILIYGGSTATGTLAIQFAKFAGQTVITTCSPKHNTLLNERGADRVYDYREKNVGEQIRKDTDGRITKVFDTVSTESTAAFCAQVFGPAGGAYASLLGPDCPRADVKSTFYLVYSASGESYIFEGESYAADPEMFEFAKKFFALAEKLWAEGRWVPHPLRIEQGGLSGINNGLQLMREGKVSGEKLVYSVNDTVWPDS